MDGQEKNARKLCAMEKLEMKHVPSQMVHVLDPIRVFVMKDTMALNVNTFVVSEK
jgi:hypothetical protein